MSKEPVIKFYEALCDIGLKPRCDWEILLISCLESLRALISLRGMTS